jgi:hypothetical protein
MPECFNRASKTLISNRCQSSRWIPAYCRGNDVRIAAPRARVGASQIGEGATFYILIPFEASSAATTVR